jgi:hypothetical protein
MHQTRRRPFEQFNAVPDIVAKQERVGDDTPAVVAVGK